jgi:SAM-dependent methyltransferase
MSDASSRSFSLAADAYAAARPTYPASLYRWVLGHAHGRGAAWDCATGNGQAAIDLSRHFSSVYASDISEAQLQHAPHRSNIAYLVQPAEMTAFADHAFDLVTVATALHWFDFTRFWPEVIRVLRPGGLFCAWAYGDFQCTDQVRQALADPIGEIVRPFWSPRNAIAWRGYLEEDLAFPFAAFRPPPMSIQLTWSTVQLAAYISTWSAYKIAAADADMGARLADALASGVASLGPDAQLEIGMPLTVIAGKAT